MTTALAPKDAYRQPPDLVAWWTGHAYTTWHINGPNGRTACGRLIGTERVTRRHHPAADVCQQCAKPPELYLCRGDQCDVCGGETCPECETFCSVWNEEHRRYIHDKCVVPWQHGRAEMLGDK